MIKVVNPEATDCAALLDELPAVFQRSQHSIHKARNELKVIQYQGKSYVLKSFKVPNLLNKLIYTFCRPSKAARSYHNSLLLEGFTPKPVAYVEYREQGLIAESYFLSEHFAYDFTIREVLLDPDFAHRIEIFKAFARFTCSLHDRGFFHKDYSPGNILIKQQGDEWLFLVVDVNRLAVKSADDHLRARGFEKLWATDTDLDIMSAEYSACSDVNTDFAGRVRAFSNGNKRRKNFKKRLKGKPVND